MVWKRKKKRGFIVDLSYLEIVNLRDRMIKANFRGSNKYSNNIYICHQKIYKKKNKLREICERVFENTLLLVRKYDITSKPTYSSI